MTNTNFDTNAQDNLAQVGGGVVGHAAYEATKDAMAGTQQQASAILQQGEVEAVVKQAHGLESANRVTEKAHHIGEGIREFPHKVADGVHKVASTIASIPGKFVDTVTDGVASAVEVTGDAAAHVVRNVADAKADGIRDHAAKEAHKTIEDGSKEAERRVGELVDQAKDAAKAVYTQEMLENDPLVTPTIPHVEL